MASPEPTIESTGRLFSCAHCHKQVIICSCCDRGQRYCSPDCATISRNKSQRAASHRYQQSRKGRLKHALRNRHYRHRKQIVTHQGSKPSAQNDLLTANSKQTGKSAVTALATTHFRTLSCHFCGNHCSEFVRLDFLYRHRVHYIDPLNRRGARNDYSP